MLIPAGNLVTLLGFDPSGNLIPLQCDANGILLSHLEAGPGTPGIMLTPAGKLVNPVAFDPSGNVLPIQVTAGGLLRIALDVAPTAFYSLQGGAIEFSPADSQSYHFAGIQGIAPNTNYAAVGRIFFPVTGTIIYANVGWINLAGVAGSANNVSAYIRINNSTDTLIATVGNTTASKNFSNISLSIAVNQGDHFAFKIVTPVWTTNPTLVTLYGVIGIQTS